MKPLSSNNSICTNCTNRGACIFENTSKEPIFSCNAYELEEKDVVSKKIKTKQKRKSPSLYSIGICTDCENVKVCCLRTKSDVIFQCEQFK